MKKSKFDWKVLYDQQMDKIIIAKCDHAVDRVWKYWHFNGTDSWYIAGRPTYLQHIIEIDRLPEWWF